MVFLVTLSTDDLARSQDDLRQNLKFTKAIPPGYGPEEPGALPLVLFLTDGRPTKSRLHQAVRDRSLVWIGKVGRWNTVGPVDRSITVQPLRECLPPVPLLGTNGLLEQLPEAHRETFEALSSSAGVTYCPKDVWTVIEDALRARSSSLASLLDWLIAQINAPVFNSELPEDRAWQEQQEAARCSRSIFGAPAAFAAWLRPKDIHAPYTAGLIPEPVEHSMIDHDVRMTGPALGLFSDWTGPGVLRSDIQILHDAEGRRLEVVNVNATPVEARLGTDLIYYHEATRSFVLVQYKRLDPRRKSTQVDERLLRQLDRLEEVAALSQSPTAPDDWRLSSDPCYLKLAYWPENGLPDHGLAPGMYLPVSYVRLLLADDCTLGERGGRVLSYKHVNRHMINTQFIELVKHGFAGTVGTTFEQLDALGRERIKAKRSVVIAVERATETVREREQRNHRRSPKKQAKRTTAPGQGILFPIDAEE
ncbi:hypothetical protein [Kitasatospora sp. NPDC059803]|uniref:hypothetical protein n=1 Tax=Kitasatospora sp. NPDC059803 TaxID=3346953 RepID=UPI0036489D58